MTAPFTLPQDLLLDLSLDEFDPGVLTRGTEYASRRMAEVEAISGEGSALTITGHCRGSGGQRYRQVIELMSLKGHTVLGFSECSCPVGGYCKHVVALLLTAAGDAPDSDHVEDDNALDDDTRAWLARLDAPEAPAEHGVSPRGDCLIYVLDPGPAQLTVGKSRPLKRGGMGRPGAFRLQESDLSAYGRRAYIGDADDSPLRLFHAMQAGQYSYNAQTTVALTGETGALLLMAAARSGRLYRVDALDTPLRVEPPRTMQLKWVLDHRERQQLAIDVAPHIFLLPTWPPHYFDPISASVGALASELPDTLLKTLLQSPALTMRQAIEARGRLEALSQRLGVSLPLPEARTAEQPSAPPEPRVRLTMGRFRHDALFSLHEEYAIAELHFDYPDGVSVAGSERPDPLLPLQQNGRKVFLRRDLQTENAVWSKLQAVGLESYQRRMPRYLRVDSDADCLMAAPADARGWLPLLGSGLAALELDGISIEYEDDFPFRLAEVDEWFVEVDESERADWFDLDLGVMVGGERISLVPPLLHLLKEQPQLLRQLEKLKDEDSLPVRLDNRRLLPIPVPRLRAWLRPLLEFLDDERPRLSRFHATALTALDEHPTHWLGGEGLLELGRRLRDFTGITHVAPPDGFNATLRNYQQAGLDWLQFLSSYGLSGILADDMGLGKTVQTLAHLLLEKRAGRADRPSLVIAPTSLMPNWAAEARQFAPDLRVLTLHGPARAQLFEDIDDADLILTTYPLLVRDQAELLAREFHLVVLDEAQFIKNPKAQSHQVARRLQARHRLSLTGTPLENHLGELWAQFDFLMPGLLGGAKRFNEVFRTPIEKHGDSEARARLAARVAPFMLRRTKEQVLQELPPRTEIVRWVELTGAQRDLYESLRIAFDGKLRAALASQGIGRSQIMILDALLKLRQACCDPRLVKLESAQRLGERGAVESAKLTELMTLIEELVDEGRRILLFSQFTSMLALIEAELWKRKLPFAKLTGQTKDRDTPVRDFQEGRVQLFMVSLKAGGTGLNLTAADTVIHYDPWWNPAVEEQATARAHRIGQDKPVFVYKLLGRGTVEEKILALQTRKRGLADQFLAGKPQDDGGHLLTAEDLDVLFEPLG